MILWCKPLLYRDFFSFKYTIIARCSPKMNKNDHFYVNSNTFGITNFNLQTYCLPNNITPITMLQKLSKCEVKNWLCWNLIILLLLRFYVKSNFGEFKRSKNVILANFRGSEFWFWKLWATFKSQIYQKSKFRVSKIAKNDIFEPFEFTKIWFHVKSE